MEWLNFRHLYSFWMVTRAGSFTGAASQMHVAQSAVSAQVAALEAYVDAQLLIRTNRSVELTSAGHELLAYANSIFEQSRAINALIKDKDALHGNRHVRVGVVGGASRNFVYRLLDDFRQKAPGVRVSVSTGSYQELYGLLRRFQLDAIVTLDLPKKKEIGEVSYKRLGESKMCIAASPGLIAELRERKTTGSLDVFKFRHPYEVDLLRKYVQPLVSRELTLRMDTDDIPLLRFFANSGKGIAVLPRVGVLEDLDLGTVDAIDLPECPEIMIYGITMHQTHAPDDGAFGLWPATPSE